MNIKHELYATERIREVMPHEIERDIRYEEIMKDLLEFRTNDLEKFKVYWELLSEDDKEIVKKVLKEYEYNNRIDKLSKIRKEAMEAYKEAKAMHEDELASEAWATYEEATTMEKIFKKIANTNQRLTVEEKLILADFFSLDYSVEKDRNELEILIKHQRDFDRRTNTNKTKF